MLKRIIIIIVTSLMGMLLLISDVYAKNQSNVTVDVNVDIEELKKEYSLLIGNIDTYQLSDEDILVKMWLKQAKIPKIVDIKRNNTALYLYWNKINGASGYYVYKKYNNGKWHEVAHFNNNQNLCYIDRAYYSTCDTNEAFFTVVAYKNINNKRVYSLYDKKGACYIETPIIRKLNEKYIKWNKVDYADGYEIMYKEANIDKWYTIATVNNNCNQYLFQEKYYKNTRYYTVKAYRQLDSGKIYSDFENKMTLRHRMYNNLNVLVEGDSTTCGSLSRSYIDNRYPARLEQLLGANIQVNANTHETFSSIAKRISHREKYFKKYDLILIAVGTNDYEKGTSIGTVVDKGINTFYGSIVYIVDKIKEQNKDAEVVFITPFYRGKIGTEINVNCNFKRNNTGYTLQDYIDSIKSVASIYKYNVYDANSEGALSRNNITFSTIDYINPNEEFHGKIGCDLVDYLIGSNIINNE